MSLTGTTITFSGRLSTTQKELEKLITSHGGNYSRSVTKQTTHLVTTQKDYDEETTKIVKAREEKIPIVNEKWLHQAIETGDWKAVDLAQYWFEEVEISEESNTTDQQEQVPTQTIQQPLQAHQAQTEIVQKQPDLQTESQQIQQQTMPQDNTVTPGQSMDQTAAHKRPLSEVETAEEPLRKKRRIATVDSDFPTKENVTILQDDSGQYDFNLRNGDQFYKTQLLDANNQFVVFSKSGTSGTNNVQHESMTFTDLDEAKKEFSKRFSDKTQNTWDSYLQGKYQATGGYTVEEPNETTAELPQSDMRADADSVRPTAA